MPRDRFAEPRNEPRIGELRGREIHRQRQHDVAFAKAPHHPARLFDDEPADILDEAVPLGDADELVRRDDAFGRIPAE